jgi:hypothetical protein
VNHFDRIRANLSQNIRSNIILLEEEGIDNNIMKRIKIQVESYIDRNNAPEEMKEKDEEELKELAVSTFNVPYEEWMMREKIKM